jgi:hypothetical protein
VLFFSAESKATKKKVHFLEISRGWEADFSACVWHLNDFFFSPRFQREVPPIPEKSSPITDFASRVAVCIDVLEPRGGLISL